MTTLLHALFLGLLVAVSVAACRVVVLVVHARNKRLLLHAMRGPRCDAPGGIGITVLCSGVTDAEQIESLLSVEYARYEVVVALDAQRDHELFADLVARYRMIRVEWSTTGELPVEGVRSVGRSRKRSYRRLVLVDRRQDDAAGDFDAAAEIATYDYLLPVQGGQYLLPGAVERLVAEVGERPAETLELVRTRLGVPAQLIAREAVIRAGGFGAHPVRKIPRAKKCTLWEPLLIRPPRTNRVPREMRLALAALLAAAIVVSAAGGMWTLTAALSTVSLLWAAAGYVVQSLAIIPGFVPGTLFPPDVALRKLRVKNFTIS